MNARPALVSWSGGKDSALAMWRARRQGWEPVALFNMLAAREERSRSHGLAPAVLAAQAQALGLPLVTARADWSDYEAVFIATLRDEARRAEAVVFGDIDLDAHREWEEKVCHAAGLEAVLPLWQQPRRALVDEMIATGFVARICTVRDHIILHGCSFGARLIAALTAAQDGLTARIDVQHRDCRIAACCQSRRRLSVRIDERTQHQIVIRLRRS